ncbi:hypothetical protein D0B54_05925 [Solimonas sp. K1W22B-7]|uniref:hypothetical protein n=1 Tax=Solimonas sp. K1W22B-7 TaxID=2303331 RepID=UPI000E333FA8|nr:hypothetical protein [Solimonas sp. K1W22B-7]AXQ28246.1 hypothetical protein D0B54_05925 [Solimonas sp. K1W22B-7]
MSQIRETGQGKGEIYLDRVLGGVALIALHEAGSLQGHLEGVSERLRVARRARNLGELLRDQIDLLPETRNRFVRDHHVRRGLWSGFVEDLTAVVEKKAA